MNAWGRFRGDARTVALSIVSHVALVLLTAAFVAVAALFAHAWRGRGFSATLTLPAWLVLLAAAVGVASAIVAYLNARRASVVRGREDATKVNTTLLTSRDVVPMRDRAIRSTRFGKWPQGEDLPNRTNFRQELDKAIIRETTLVQRIWNISSEADAIRLREMLKRYQGRENHYIRLYFNVPDHVMPELLIVEKRGASISFASTSKQQSLDWAVLFKRQDLVQVIRDYFEVLWEHAEKILHGGELVAGGEAQLAAFEQQLSAGRQPP
jgi:hypothetical protein